MTKLRTIIAAIACFALAGMFTGCDTNNNNETGNGNNPQPVIHTVTFNSNGGTAVQPQQVTHGQRATRPADPTRNFYTFGNWYTNANLTTVFNFSAPVTENVTLYARWVTTRTLWLYMDNVEIPPDPMYNNFANLDDIFNWIADNALNNRTYRIVLGRDIERQSRIDLTPGSVNNRTNVTIILEGRDRERIITYTGSIFSFINLDFGNTNTLILERNLTLRGGGVIGSSGRLEMRDGSKITKAGRVGVNVITFIMRGGTITYNGHALDIGSAVGGGVMVFNNSRFEMMGGTISNNTGINAGGVYVAMRRSGNIRAGEFIKTGGTITENTSLSGIGHSVHLRDDTFTVEQLNQTVGSSHNLDSSIRGAAGGWVDR